ncbi:MAG: homoserine kinase [Gammaproteobacteria bacterium]
MAVYTRVERDELEVFLRDYSLGSPLTLEGIADGIENSNYWLTTSTGEYVLTVFERVETNDVDYFLDLMAYLAEHGIPCPAPVANRAGQRYDQLQGRPAAICARLPGAPVDTPGPAHCAAVGQALGRWHRVGADFDRHRDNSRALRWWRELDERVRPRLDADAAALLDAELHFQSLFRLNDLPRGPIHADLFRDNVLFEGEELTGLLDCYDACDDVLLYDLAIAANDWCVQPDGSLDGQRLAALTGAYHRERPISAIERGAWPTLLRAAALRFWVSRLHDAAFPRPGSLTQTKDPAVFQRILEQRVARREPLPMN